MPRAATSVATQTRAHARRASPAGRGFRSLWLKLARQAHGGEAAVWPRRAVRWFTAARVLAKTMAPLS